MLLETVADTADFTPGTATAATGKGGLTDSELRGLAARPKAYKVSDSQGLYVMVLPSGTRVFRFDYRLNVDGILKRETLTVGRYEPGTDNRSVDEIATLEYGAVMSLKDARVLRDRASCQVKAGVSPSRGKVQKRVVDVFGQLPAQWWQIDCPEPGVRGCRVTLPCRDWWRSFAAIQPERQVPRNLSGRARLRPDIRL